MAKLSALAKAKAPAATSANLSGIALRAPGWSRTAPPQNWQKAKTQVQVAAMMPACATVTPVDCCIGPFTIA